MQAVRQQLGEGFTVKSGGRDDVFSVSQGTMSGAKVHIRQREGATEFHVHGTGIIIGRIINELMIARRVASAISKAPLASAGGAEPPATQSGSA
jgi:hypothetical protein